MLLGCFKRREGDDFRHITIKQEMIDAKEDVMHITTEETSVT